MKKVFWISYGVLFLIIVGVGYLMISGLSTENKALSQQNDGFQSALKDIEKKIDEKKLPNKRWPQALNERFATYTKVNDGLKERLKQYNVWTTNRIPANIDLFDGEFKKLWLTLFNELFTQQFSILNGKINKTGIKNQFESGNIHKDLGVPMSWVAPGGIVRAISTEQRQIAEEQFWIQKKIIGHFIQAELNNNYKNYKLKPVDVKPAAGGAGFGTDFSLQPQSKAPSFNGIFFGKAQMGGGFGEVETNRDYVVAKEFTDEYVFTAKFRIRASSLHSFVNSLLIDREMFFVIDDVSVKAIFENTKKHSWDLSNDYSADYEPPVEVTLKAKVLTFDFSRLVKQEEKKGTKKKG